MRKLFLFIALFCAFSVFASVSANFQHVKLSKAIMYFAKTGKINVIIPIGMKEPIVSINLNNVEPLNAIRALCRTFNLNIINMAGIYIVKNNMKPPIRPFSERIGSVHCKKAMKMGKKIRKRMGNDNENSLWPRKKIPKNPSNNMILQKNNKIRHNIAKTFRNMKFDKFETKIPVKIISADISSKSMTILAGNRKVVLKEGQSYRNRIELLKVENNKRVLVYYPELMIRKIEKIK